MTDSETVKSQHLTGYTTVKGRQETAILVRLSGCENSDVTLD